MKIEKLYVYPVKSLRGVEVDSSTLTKFGLTYDRRFMTLQVVKDDNGSKSLKNMAVAHYNEMVRFFPKINTPQSMDSGQATMNITFKPIDGGEQKAIDIPLKPDTSDLEEIDITMHNSPTQAYKMDTKYNRWFSECFGYECVLAYIGEHTREVMMTSTSYRQHTTTSTTNSATSWLSSITSIASKAAGFQTADVPDTIKFSDVAPYLIVSSRSMDAVMPRLNDDSDFDITKFRPNIIVSGAQEAWEEDFWGELTITNTTNNSSHEAKIELEHNCNRCKSINIDYATGAQGTQDAGKMLKYLSKDRRIDPGAKWSPVFGRYGFLLPGCGEGVDVRVGNKVLVTRVNGERTAFDWKGLNTLGK